MSDVLFMPSFNELFPMAILEAVNAHKPVLLRDLDLYVDILFEKYEKGAWCR
jgi:1,2-diacylglycerol-3-alpha-glucose alpha-1,2-galactosyltransferase